MQAGLTRHREPTAGILPLLQRRGDVGPTAQRLLPAARDRDDEHPLPHEGDVVDPSEVRQLAHPATRDVDQVDLQGYELDGAPLGVLATGPLSSHIAQLLPDWGPTTLFTRGQFEPDVDQLRALDRRGVTIERTPVVAIEGAADLRLADARVVRLAGVFVLSHARIATPLATELGCELEDGPLGQFVKADPMRETSVRGVFAAGDMAVVGGGIAVAVADGARAGVSAHQSLVFR